MVLLTFEMSGAEGRTGRGRDGAAVGGAWVLRREDPGPALVKAWWCLPSGVAGCEPCVYILPLACP